MRIRAELVLRRDMIWSGSATRPEQPVAKQTSETGWSRRGAKHCTRRQQLGTNGRLSLVHGQNGRPLRTLVVRGSFSFDPRLLPIVRGGER